MEIFKNDYNTMQMQVEENKKNIQKIASIIKESYRSNVQLSSIDVSVAISDTNADASTTEGWLIDPIGKIFKITSGDGTNLLIEFYSDIRGAQGDQGEQGEQGEQGTDGFSIHFINEDYVLSQSTYNRTNVSNNTPIKLKDVLLFKNGYISLIDGISTYTIGIDDTTTIKLDIGKQLYQHNIAIRANTTYIQYDYYCTIISDRAEAYDLTSLQDYLQIQVPQNYGIIMSGKGYYQSDNVPSKFASRIYYSTNQNAIRIETINTQFSVDYKEIGNGVITDNVKSL